MFGIGGFEFFLILLFAFLVFGPDRLPALAKTVGQAIAKLRSMQSEMNEVVKTEIYEPAGIDPNKNPLEALEDLGNQALAESEGTKPKQAKAQESENAYLATFAERKAKYDAERAAQRAAFAQDQGSVNDSGQPSREEDDGLAPTVSELYGNLEPVKADIPQKNENTAFGPSDAGDNQEDLPQEEEQGVLGLDDSLGQFPCESDFSGSDEVKDTEEIVNEPGEDKINPQSLSEELSSCDKTSDDAGLKSDEVLPCASEKKGTH